MDLIINGDDFGITAACNAVIIDCWKKGRLTSCSLMTNMPAAQEAAWLWKAYPDLCVGLHACVTAGRPLTKAPSLVKEDGSFDKRVLGGEKACDPADIEREVRAQMDRFIELTGRKPDHLDSHHGIERIPGGAAIMAKLAREYDLPLRHFLEGKMPEDLPFQVPPVSLGMSDDWHALSPDQFVQVLPEEGIFELALHPGRADEQLARLSGLRKGREADAANLLSEKFGRWLEEKDVRLISWKEVGRRS